MGFFSSIIKTIGGIGRAVLGIQAPAAVPAARSLAAAPFVAAGAAARVLARSRPAVAGVSAALGAGLGAGGTLLAGALFDSEGQPVSACPGNATNVKRTLVQTISRETGQVICTEVLRGSPFLMRKDIQTAKRVIKTAAKLGQVKGLRHTVKQSVASRTKDAIEAKVLAEVTKGVC